MWSPPGLPARASLSTGLAQGTLRCGCVPASFLQLGHFGAGPGRGAAGHSLVCARRWSHGALSSRQVRPGRGQGGAGWGACITQTLSVRPEVDSQEQSCASAWFWTREQSCNEQAGRTPVCPSASRAPVRVQKLGSGPRCGTSSGGCWVLSPSLPLSVCVSVSLGTCACVTHMCGSLLALPSLRRKVEGASQDLVSSSAWLAWTRAFWRWPPHSPAPGFLTTVSWVCSLLDSPAFACVWHLPSPAAHMHQQPQHPCSKPRERPDPPMRRGAGGVTPTVLPPVGAGAGAQSPAVQGRGGRASQAG